MTCAPFDPAGPSAIAGALRTVDCMSADAAALAFSRLFGGQGMLTGALTIVLTLYVACFAIGLLTGRASLSLTSLTPRMMGLGLALTFATSWLAYSQVIWTLLAAGPDWIAGMLLGTKGSASQAFAARLDLIFGAVVDAAEQARQAAKDAKGTTPADLLSYAALLLMLGTVGVLVAARVALGAMIALGPIFVVLAIFPGTRGLFEGWLRTAVMLALVPLLAVLIGVASVAMLGPVVADLAGGEIDLRQAAAVFVIAAIHCGLMALAFRLVGSLTAGWHIPATPPEAMRQAPRADRAIAEPARTLTTHAAGTPAAAPSADDRVRAVVAAGAPRGGEPGEPGGSRTVRLPGVTITSPMPASAAAASERTRAGDLGRKLRLVPAISAIKETSP